MKNKIKLMLCIFLSLNALCATADDTQKKLSADDMNQLTGFAAYNATIIGYAMSCEFNKSDIKLIYDQFFQEAVQLPLTEEQKKDIDKSFLSTLSIAKQKGVANSNTTCAAFKTDFDKMIQDIKTGKLNIK